MAPIRIEIDTDKTPQKSTKKELREKPKPFLSDETALFLIALLRRQRVLPDFITIPKKMKSDVLNRPDSNLSNEKSPPQKTSEEIQEELAAVIREKISPILWSVLFHTCVLILLALLFFPKVKNDSFDILSRIDLRQKNAVDLQIGLNSPDNDPPVIVETENPPVENPVAAPPVIEVTPDGPLLTSKEMSDKPPGLSILQRDEAGRAKSLGPNGGSGETDQSVLAGLRWLVRVQMRDGSWRLSGPFTNGSTRKLDNPAAATALALLAFQGYDVKPNSKEAELSEFAKSVKNGWDWLLLQQDLESGSFFRESSAPNDHRFYTHGLCTIAVCEILAMTKDEKYRVPAEKAVAYCLKHQSVEGGWKYSADRWNSGSDLSVTGWIVLALKTAEMAGIAVSPDVYDKITAFLDSVQNDGGSRYLYQKKRGETPRISMTAEGLFCRLLLGWKKENLALKRGIALLVEPTNLPSFTDYTQRNVYSWYYATQILRHCGGVEWEIWNEIIRTELPKNQETKGTAAGSWNPISPTEDEWGKDFGRLYTTCLSILILEVYYRHDIQ
ncbi:MAG: prenyltransferase/squalene oxidase repeat-containing protein [Thermoguttaceae bacterium]